MPPGNGQGKPPDWIPPGLRPEAEDDPWDELHGDWYWGVDDGFANELSSFADDASGGFYTLFWISPSATSVILPQLTPKVTVQAHSNDGTLMTVEVEQSTNSSFTSGVTTTTLLNQVSDTPLVVTLPTLLDRTQYYLRARAGGSGNWSEWMGPIAVYTNTAMSHADEYILENVGLDVFVPFREAYESVVENVGLEVFVPFREAYESVLEGDVNTLTPNPVIWFIEPNAGRPNDGFDIYGLGFGATQGAYNGVAYLDPGPTGVRRDLSLISWVEVPANSVAYDKERLWSETSVARPELYRADNFDGTGAVDAGWSAASGATSAWSVAGGLLQAPPTEDVLYSPGVDTGTVTVTANGPTGKIVVRYHDPANYFYLNLVNNDLVRVLAGVEVTVAAWAGAAVAGDLYEVVVTPTTIEAKRNGVSMGTVSDSNLGDGAVYECSVGVRGATTDRWRSFLWDSGIDPDTRFDMQHQRISVSIPSDAIPPGYLVRVETDGA